MISRGFVEDLPRLDVAFAREFFLDNALLDVEVDVDGEHVIQHVQLTTTALPRRGGRRWWWSCPRCGKRARHLYPTFGLVCRACAGLKYRSQYCHDKHEDFGFH